MSAPTPTTVLTENDISTSATGNPSGPVSTYRQDWVDWTITVGDASNIDSLILRFQWSLDGTTWVDLNTEDVTSGAATPSTYVLTYTSATATTYPARTPAFGYFMRCLPYTNGDGGGGGGVGTDSAVTIKVAARKIGAGV